ncbi:putative calpain cysteine peptidase [Trypanosoma cruzi]|nr:putative calpain cysteine peptidase [Trypanosoma cruzi]
MEQERRQLLEKDPRRNAKEIAALEESMNARAQELAREKKLADRAFLDQKPEGVPLRELPLDDDSDFVAMEQERRQLLEKDPRRNAKEIAALEESMNARAQELAREKKLADRAFLDQKPEGVPLRELPLDDDSDFVAMEQERRQLLEKDPRRNAKEIAALEESMNARAQELAREKKLADRAFLDQKPEGVPLRELPLDDDSDFVAMEQERRQLLEKDPRRNAREIAALEESMNARAQELAREKKLADRAFLDQKPEGVPLRELPLDDDSDFVAMEQERRQLLEKDPRRNAKEIAALEESMNARAQELAREKKLADRAFLDQKPEGVPLRELPLDDDSDFVAMEQERRQLLEKDPRRNAKEIAALEESMNARAQELAREKKLADRAFLDQKPEGVPLRELPLDDDSDFVAMEQERRQLLEKDPRRNAKEIAALEESMNARAQELAREKKLADRAFLDQKPEGVPLRELPLDDDSDFVAMEQERRQLLEKDPRRNAREIAALEESMNARAQELAREKKLADRAFLDQKPEGVPLRELPLDDDSDFVAMEQERRQLLEKDPRRNAKEIAALEESMNARAQELAREKKLADRAFLDQKPEGVPLRELPLDDDSDFVAMEQERRQLLEKDPRRNAKEIAALEESMNARAQELAREKKLADRAFLDQKPEGVPLRELPLDDDSDFVAMEQERRQLLEKDPRRNAREIAALEESMNARAQELAREKKLADRAFLDQKPEGVPLRELPLDDDSDFVAMEQERRQLLEKDPRRNAKEIAALEESMNARAQELAREKKLADRAFLDQKPEGVPLRELPLDDDSDFVAMEQERRQLLEKDPRRNARRSLRLRRA